MITFTVIFERYVWKEKPKMYCDLIYVSACLPLLKGPQEKHLKTDTQKNKISSRL